MCPGILAQTNKETAVLTDDQGRAMPLAELIDVVIPQQRSAYELQVWVHETLPEFENLRALNWAELRQGNFIYRRAGLMNKDIQFAESAASETEKGVTVNLPLSSPPPIMT
jgi:hypothetical protein